MSGLAELLLMRGIVVSGSDAARNKKTRELASLGATISIGHDAMNLSDADTVVYSSAIDEHNTERIEAERRGIRSVRRADFLGEIVRDHIVIAVAGTHGKTTVTSMIASVLIEAGLDPLVLVGASVKELGGKNSRAGAGKIALIEADEYDRSFLALGGSYIAVMTSLEAEHLDTYGNVESLKDAFVQFANQEPSTISTYLRTRRDEERPSSIAKWICHRFDRRTDAPRNYASPSKTHRQLRDRFARNKISCKRSFANGTTRARHARAFR